MVAKFPKRASSTPRVLAVALMLSGCSAFNPSNPSPLGRLPRGSHALSSCTTLRSTALYQLSIPTNQTNENLEKPRSRKASRKKLSRPERKRAERQKKKPAGGDGTAARRKEEGGVGAPLCPDTTTPDDVSRLIKRGHRSRSHADLEELCDFLVDGVSPSYAYGYRGSLLSRLAVACLHCSRADLSARCLAARAADHAGGAAPAESAALVRALDRAGDIEGAEFVLNDELALPQPYRMSGGTADPLAATERDAEVLLHRCRSLRSVALWRFHSDDPVGGVATTKRLAELGPVVRTAQLPEEEAAVEWERLVEEAAQCEGRRRKGQLTIPDGADLPCNIVYAVLDAMGAFPSENDDATFERLANALVRRVEFVTGAVGMAGLPLPDRGEVAFIGRSNVGKSSLVNMVTNRRSLAYTSKTPGKTQQYNYFAVNDKPELARQIRYGDEVGGEKDTDSFYIADLPGFGYAKVPEAQRLKWSEFLAEYMEKRPNLRVIFHLVDSRHGPVAGDEAIMEQAAAGLRKGAKYVVVMTKADKNIKGSTGNDVGKVSRSVMEKVRAAMRRAGVKNAPVLLTSAETKLGRDDVWRYLRLAAEL